MDSKRMLPDLELHTMEIITFFSFRHRFFIDRTGSLNSSNLDRKIRRKIDTNIVQINLTKTISLSSKYLYILFKRFFSFSFIQGINVFIALVIQYSLRG